jgi:hypothetical protein
MKTIFTLILCVFTLGCALHHPVVPHLMTRPDCASGLVEAPGIYNGEVVMRCWVPEPTCVAYNASVNCLGISATECALKMKPCILLPDTLAVGEEDEGSADEDEAKKDTGNLKPHPWWKFWVKEKNEED